MCLDENLICYKILPIWTPETLPEAFKLRHNTKAGTWAKLKILSGNITMEFMSDEGAVIQQSIFSVDYQPPLIKPKQYHRIAYCSEDMRCQLSFYSEKE